MQTIVESRGDDLPHLRVSVHGDCNFRCTYCPPWGENSYEIGRSLSTPELIRVFRSLSKHGFRVVKVTGGEPTLRRDVIDIVRIACELFEDVRIITNGWSLAKMAEDLAEAGLSAIEVSLDALDPQLFDSITQSKGMLPKVLEGVESSRHFGLAVQLNMVVMRKNLVEIERMIDFIEDTGAMTLKLLELVYYEYPGFDYWVRNFVDMLEVMPVLDGRSQEVEWLTPPGAFGTPMRIYHLANGSAVIVKDGSVGAVYASICEDCPLFPCQDGLYGLSLTSDGALKMCKHRPDLHLPLRRGQNTAADEGDSIDAVVLEVVERYRSAYFLSNGWSPLRVEHTADAKLVEPTAGLLRWYRNKEYGREYQTALKRGEQRSRLKQEEA
jgi:GTP 3',8-cyclase